MESVVSFEPARTMGTPESGREGGERREEGKLIEGLRG
jgi:hypothetical protein